MTLEKDTSVIHNYIIYNTLISLMTLVTLIFKLNQKKNIIKIYIEIK